jgi:hypothetical protein
MPQPAIRVGLFDDGLPIKSAVVNFASASQTVVPNSTSVWRLLLIAAAAAVVTLQDGSNALTGPLSLATGVPLVLDFSSRAWFICQTNFTIAQSGTVQISGTAYFT